MMVAYWRAGYLYTRHVQVPTNQTGQSTAFPDTICLALDIFYVDFLLLCTAQTKIGKKVTCD